MRSPLTLACASTDATSGTFDSTFVSRVTSRVCPSANFTVIFSAVVSPGVFMKTPGETTALKITVKFADGQTRDVTRETNVESNVPDVASVDAQAKVKGERMGEATMLVRYQGKFQAIPVTVLNPKPGFAWKPLPQHNFIDRLIDVKLERLHIQPSNPADDAAFLRRVTLDLTGGLPAPE